MVGFGSTCRFSSGPGYPHLLILCKWIQYRRTKIKLNDCQTNGRGFRRFAVLELLSCITTKKISTSKVHFALVMNTVLAQCLNLQNAKSLLFSALQSAFHMRSVTFYPRYCGNIFHCSSHTVVVLLFSPSYTCKANIIVISGFSCEVIARWLLVIHFSLVLILELLVYIRKTPVLGEQ